MSYAVGAHSAVAEQVANFRKAGNGEMLKKLMTRVVEILGQCPDSDQYRLRGSLAAVSRFKSGRVRVFFIYSSALARVTILYIGYRKAGAGTDAYVEFEALLKRGCFDGCFDELALAKPQR